MKKVTACVLAFILLVSVLPFSAIAKEINKIDFYMSASIENADMTYDFSHGRAKSSKNYYGTFPMTGRYYDQLTSSQKEVYNVLLNADIDATDIEFEFSSPVTVPSSDGNWDTVSDIIFTAFFAFCKDYPEIFWYHGCSWGTNNAWYIGNSNDIAVGGAQISINYYTGYSPSPLESVYNQMLAVVNSFKPAGATRYEKLRSIHDFLICKATYDPNYDNSNAAPYGHQPTGCLLSPYLCVCEGYAESFKIFADREGIPNMLVYSEGHVWNVVLMEDNKWYAIDCTWDDPMTGNSNINWLCYDFFLVGSTTVSDGQSVPFSQQEDHTEISVYTDSKGNSLQNPPLNSVSYAPFYPKYTYHTNGVQSNDYPGGSILQSSRLIFICPGTSVKNCFDFNTYGSYSYNGGDKTGTSLIFTTNAGVSNTYTVIMRGDVSRDAKVNNTDLNSVMSISTGNTSYSATAPETYAGDCNGDGVVDGFDLALLDRYQSGHYSFY